MNKTVKIILIVVLCLILVGAVFAAGLLVADRFGFVQIGKYTLHTNTTEVFEDFQNIEIDVDASNVTLALSQDETCRVECREPDRLRHRVAVRNGTLYVSLDSGDDLLSRVGLHSETLGVTVYLPRAEYHNLNVETDTGAITLRDTVVNGMSEISSDTGEITISHCQLSRAELDSDSADILLNYTTCGGTLKAESDVGNVIFDQSDAAEILVETDTGDISGTLLSDKVFTAKSRTGMVVVPESLTGGRCVLNSDTGNIQVRIR